MAMMQFYVGVKAAIVKDDKMLVVHNHRGFWDLPGGRIDDDESITETLQREIHEELPSSTGAKIGGIVTAYRKLKTKLQDGMGLVLIVYRADVTFANDKVVISEEHDEFRWVTRAEAEELDEAFIIDTFKKL